MSKNTSTKVTLDINELKRFVNHTVNNNRFLQSQGKVPLAICVEGPAGLGKTSSIEQLSGELNINSVKLCLSELEEISDLIGFPTRQYQLCRIGEAPKAQPKKSSSKTKKKITKKELQKVTVMEEQEVDDFKIEFIPKQVMNVSTGKFETKQIENKIPIKVKKEVPVEREVEVDVEVEIEDSSDTPIVLEPVGESECLWIDEHAINEYIKQGYTFTGEKRMSYCPPEWIVGKGENGILLLDDYSRADPRFIQATMTLIDRQKFVSWELPKGWTVILSTNPDDGNYQVNSLDIAQTTRFATVNLKFNIECWMSYAEKAGVDSRCINFLGLHPELVTEECNPRAITNFFNSIASIEDFNKDLPIIQLLGEASVGPDFATFFNMFIANKLDKLISPKDILLHDDEDHVVKRLKDSIGSGTDYRADIASVLATRTINWGLYYAESNSISQKTIDRLIMLCTNPDLFTTDLQYVLVKSFLNRNKQKFQKMMVNPTVMEMSMK